ncbi:MAG: AbrB/MazE/SpoVT family DNA-binding domain-containing protein [Methylacidiphilales bacterium]|nr:AbrB/MazE/SpoVT family DNA-binding domain-containing protein [Candidatus Methylacidiphilales bacterium]
MKITSKGQVTIPLEFRTRYGFLPDTSVRFVPDKRGLRLVKDRQKKGRGSNVVEALIGTGSGKWTTDEILKLTRG